MTTIFLDAKPAALTFPVDRCAVVVVDMQNDFGSNGGMFQLAGIDIAPIKKIVPNVAALIACARDAGMPVVYLKQQHSADLANAGAPRAPHYLKHQPLRIGDVVTAPDGSESRILIEDTWNTAVINDLAPEPGDIVIAKHRYSGFFQTELDKRLREKGIETLIFAGATTSICVESTVRDGMFLDYVCIVLSDCTAEPIANEASRSNHEASLLNIQLLFGWVAQLSDLQYALAGVARSGPRLRTY